MLPISTITGPLFDITAAAPPLPPAAKSGRRRGRKRLPFIPKPTPSSKVLQILGRVACLDFDSLCAESGIGEDQLGLALSNLIINTRQVKSFESRDVRYYCRSARFNMLCP